MPIYDYRCSECGFQKDYLQKLSDAPLTTCPSCGKASFNKLLSAPGFQLTGSGWYATDFKGGSSPAPSKTEAAPASSPSSASPSSGSGDSTSGGCGTACPCH